MPGAKPRTKDKVILNDDSIKDFKKIDGLVVVTPVVNISGAEIEVDREPYSV